MLTIFKKIFGKADRKKSEPLAPPPPSPAAAQMQFESAIQLAKVEVAKLSLAAVAARFSEDVRALLLKQPDATTTVALPVQTIVKQLANGVVRMSLASLHRQSPAGMFKPLPAGDKRMVEVPLTEVFKHVKPTVFKRRTDQRATDMPPEDLALFNDRNKPKTSLPAPARAETKAAVLDLTAEVEDTAAPAEPAAALTAMRIVAPPSDLKVATAKTAPAKAAAPKPVTATPVAAPVAEPQPASPSSAAPLVLPLAKVSDKWPESITSELSGLDPATTVSLPSVELAAGMARGKVAFTWGQLRAWLTPSVAGSSAVDPTTELVLPLKVVAPAFLAQTKRPTTPRKTVEVDETIPALFTGKQAPAAPVAEPAPVVLEIPETPVAEAPAVVVEEDRSAQDEVSAEVPVSESPAAEAPPETPEASVPAEIPAEPAPAAPTSSLGAAFGEPEKDQWTPAELVARVVKLRGVAGAVVALQEGFQVAQSLPDGINAETVSAFLPQIFGRLNQYAGEMKLGEVDDLLFTTRGAHCLIYRLGTLYFAVLGKPGASLPWNELRLVAAELSRQVQK